MNVIIFGASGMVGQAILRVAVAQEDVRSVTIVVRSALAISHPKLRQLVTADPVNCDLSTIAADTLDACFYCIGASATHLSEPQYRALTRDATLAAAAQLRARHRKLHFVYVSAHGADSSEHGKIMWARVRGEVENSLRAMPLRALTIVRPALIQPLDGIRSKTAGYRWFYRLAAPWISILRLIAPRYILTTRSLGQAMYLAARRQEGIKIMGPRDILRLAQASSAAGHR